MVILFVGICFLILLFVLLNILYKRTNAYKNSRLDIRQFDVVGVKKYDIVNLGSTYSKYAFGAARKLKLNHGDFSLQSQSLEMDEKILLEHVGEIAPNGVVVIVVAACLLLYREKSGNILYADIVKKSSIKLKLKNYINRIVPLAIHPKKARKILFDEIYKRDIYDNYEADLDAEKSEEELATLNKIWIDLFGLSDLKHVYLSRDNLNIVDQNVEHIKNIISICEKHNLRPVVLIPPFSDRLNGYFSCEFKKKIILESIDEAIKGRDIPVLDYQYDDYFQTRYHLFADGGFRLNKMGSMVFLKRFFDDLRKYNIVVNDETMGL